MTKVNHISFFDLDENGKYKKEDVISFCKLFNPNMRISHYFQNNGSNLLTSIKILVRKNRIPNSVNLLKHRCSRVFVGLFFSNFLYFFF